MTFFLPIFGVVTILLFLLLWSLRPPRSGEGRSSPGMSLEESAPRCATYFPIMLQVVSAGDIAFITERGLVKAARRARKERRRVLLLYLAELRGEFEKLLNTARVITALSPEVAASVEFEQVRLSLQFMWRYRLVRAGLYSGVVLLPQLNGISQIAGSLALQLEKAMRELGERAALAAEAASSLDRGTQRA